MVSVFVPPPPPLPPLSSLVPEPHAATSTASTAAASVTLLPLSIASPPADLISRVATHGALRA